MKTVSTRFGAAPSEWQRALLNQCYEERPAPNPKHVLAFCRKVHPYYGDLKSELAWTQIPVLHKCDIQRISPIVDSPWLYRLTTSGTSGQTVRVVYNIEEARFKHALNMRPLTLYYRSLPPGD